MKNLIKHLGRVIAASAAALLLLIVFFHGLSGAAASAPDGAALQPPPPAKPAAPPPAIDIAGRGYWVLVANQSYTTTTYASRANSLALINTASGAVRGPFLEGQLGSADGGLFDVDVAPDGVTALVSNFGDSNVFVVNFSDPLSPSLVTTVTMPMFAEDIAFTPDGRFALVTDGGFSSPIVTIDMASYTLAYSNVLTQTYSQAVTAAPDGTILTIDYFGSHINALTIDAAGVITYANIYTLSYSLPSFAPTQKHIVRPVNVVIAPDNQTIIVCDSTTSTLPIYRLTAPGVLTFTGVVTGVGLLDDVVMDYGEWDEHTEYPRAQSVAFDETGEHAYVLLNGYLLQEEPFNLPNHVAVLDILGPGQVRLNPVPPIPMSGQYPSSSQLFGVDTLVVAGDQVYVSHPVLSGAQASNPLQVINLADYSTYAVPAGFENGEFYYLPVGVSKLPMRLDLRKTANLSAPRPGSLISYTLSLVNHGPQITGLAVGDVLPPGLAFSGGVTLDPPMAGGVGGVPADLVHDLTIAANGQVTITYSALVSRLAGGQTLTNTAWAENPLLLTRQAQAVHAATVIPFQVYLPLVTH